MHRRTLPITVGLLASLALGCGSLKSMIEEKQAEAPAEPPAPAPEPVAEPAPVANPWRVLIVLDRTADRSFDAPIPPLTEVLASTDVQLVQVYDANPVELKGADGDVRGRLEISAVTDAETGYIFAEEGRPATYLAPAGLGIVLQQAGAYFKTEFPRPTLGGAAAADGEGKAGKVGKAGKAGKAGHPLGPGKMGKAGIRERAGTPQNPPVTGE